jgi:hypothetical protein
MDAASDTLWTRMTRIFTKQFLKIRENSGHSCPKSIPLQHQKKSLECCNTHHNIPKSEIRNPHSEIPYYFFLNMNAPPLLPADGKIPY